MNYLSLHQGCVTCLIPRNSDWFDAQICCFGFFSTWFLKMNGQIRLQNGWAWFGNSTNCISSSTGSDSRSYCFSGWHGIHWPVRYAFPSHTVPWVLVILAFLSSHAFFFLDFQTSLFAKCYLLWVDSLLATTCKVLE